MLVARIRGNESVRGVGALPQKSHEVRTYHPQQQGQPPLVLLSNSATIEFTLDNKDEKISNNNQIQWQITRLSSPPTNDSVAWKQNNRQDLTIVHPSEDRTTAIVNTNSVGLWKIAVNASGGTKIELELLLVDVEIVQTKVNLSQKFK